MQDLPGDRVIQLVISNAMNPGGFSSPHGMHLHGHSFAVLKVSYSYASWSNIFIGMESGYSLVIL